MIKNDKISIFIKNNPLIYNYLRDDSSHYKYLYRDLNYFKTIENLAKEKYKLRTTDKLEKLKNNIELITTFIDVMK